MGLPLILVAATLAGSPGFVPMLRLGGGASGSGGFSGTCVANAVAYGTGASALSCEAAFTYDATTNYLELDAGRFGLGRAPTMPLDVYGSNAAGAVQSGFTNAGAGGRFELFVVGDDANLVIGADGSGRTWGAGTYNETAQISSSAAGIDALGIDIGLSSASRIAMDTLLSAARTPTFTLLSTQRIGILNESPATELDLAGTMTLTSSATARGSLAPAGSENSTALLSSAASGGAFNADADGVAYSGSRGAISANTRVWCAGESISAGSASALLCVNGNGLLEMTSTQSITIATNGAGTPATDTTAPTAMLVKVTCNDPDGCNYNLAVGSVPTGSIIHIVNVSAANTVTTNDDGSTIFTRGASIALAAGDMETCVLTSSAWHCQ